jgi:hypothetical protein
LGQLQTENKMDEEKFEADAEAFAVAEFDAAQWVDFAAFLVNGPDPDKKTDKTVNPNYTVPENKKMEFKGKLPHQALENLKFVKHKDGPFYKWVVVVRMLRNIFSHQKDLKWDGLKLVKTHILRYMKSPTTIARFIHVYQACRKA